MSTSPERTIRVVVADDHVPTRASLRRTLEAGGFDVCGEAASAASCVEQVRQTLPDLALVDVRMPGNGLRAATDIITEFPQIKVVMLTVSRSDEDLFEALLNGAAGYLLKDTPHARLPAILHAVLQGENVIPRTLMSHVVEEFRRRGRPERRPPLGPNHAVLTEREWDVLEDLARGATTAEIAARLFIAPVTVRTHVAAIAHKMGVPDRAAAVAVFEQLDHPGR